MNSPNPICHLCWVPCPFLCSQFAVYILTSFILFLLHISLSIFQSRYYLPFLFLSPILSAPMPEKSKAHLTQDWQLFHISWKCFFNQQSTSTSVSVSLASRVQQCVPLTWSSWLQYLMGGSRSRNQQNLFGRLSQMKSSRSQGASCNQFMHLCSGCY